MVASDGRNGDGAKAEEVMTADPVDVISRICDDGEGDKLNRISAVLGVPDETLERSKPTLTSKEQLYREALEKICRQWKVADVALAGETELEIAICERDILYGIASRALDEAKRLPDEPEKP